MIGNVAFIVASESVAVWLGRFLGARSESSFIVMGNTETSEIIGTLSDKNVKEVYFISDHESLTSDRSLASQLMQHGFTTSVQNEKAIDVGLDKLKQKHFLEENFLPTASRQCCENSQSVSTIGLVKKYRYGTQAQGHSIFSQKTQNTEENEEAYFFEEFVAGIEYSVNIYSCARGNIIFPAVDKGRTRDDLTPPYGRMRIIDADFQNTHLAKEMKATAAHIATLLRSNGFLEVEFIVDSRNRAMVLEINPRVSGTLRMSAMACNIPVFDLCTTDGYRNIEREDRMFGWALEIPNRSCGVLPGNYQKAIATTRITMRSDDRDGLFAELIALQRMGVLSEKELKSYVDDLKNYSRTPLG